ncbi:hypothetical protein HK101_008854 [Irineochytrium annulatum]|nr:hypothetical protein HK101_008854 [Irineochytrium annulatum]
MNAPSCVVADYVRRVGADVRLKSEVVASLAAGTAFESLPESAVIFMVDISGYSKTSADLAVLGKMASELMTKHIGQFMNQVQPSVSSLHVVLTLPQIIDVIALYQGEIVKFLGDALLVVFTSGHHTSDAVLRALACCVHIATRHAVVRLETTIADVTSFADGFSDHNSNGQFRSLELNLHFAITSGSITRIVVGDPGKRMDYSIQGACLPSLGYLLNETGKGDMGISTDAVKLLPARTREALQASCKHHTNTLMILRSEELQSLVPCIFSTIVDDVITITETDVATSFYRLWGDVVSRPEPLNVFTAAESPDPSFIRKFVNQSLLRKMDAMAESRMTARRTTEDVQTNLYRSTRATTLRNGEAVELGLDAEFRSVCVAAVGILFPFDRIRVQGLVCCFLDALSQFGGVFQQYSVDDKGQCLLAVFGLPPFSHINNSDQCLKAMKQFILSTRNLFKGEDHVRFCVTASTGDILFTRVGNDVRCEAGLFGDTIVTAVRLLSYASSQNDTVLIDAATFEHVEALHNVRHVGEVLIKGKSKPIMVYGLPVRVEEDSPAAFGGGGVDDNANVGISFGYEEERGVILDRFRDWVRDGTRAVVFIEAPSGLGKSCLAKVASQAAEKNQLLVCTTQGLTPSDHLETNELLLGNEMEQWNPYFGLRTILTFILTCVSIAPAGVRASVEVRRKISVRTSYTSVATTTTALGRSRLGNVRLLEGAMPFLKKAGVEGPLIPLLATILPDLDVEESAECAVMDGQAKNNLLRSMLVKIITAFLQESKVVFVVDDIQWLDSKAIEVLALTARFVPQLFLVMLSRPVKDSVNKSIKTVLALPDTSHLVLEGLTEETAVKMMEWRFKKASKRITSIDGAIVEAIYAKASGSPLFIQMITDLVLYKIGNEIVIQDDGKLTLRNPGIDVASISDLSSAVLFQFDRLNTTFQMLLKVASVLGQYFNLSDVLTIGDFQFGEHEAIDKIRRHDLYDFLVVQECLPDTSSVVGYASNGLSSAESEDGVPLPQRRTATRRTNCSFRHISILIAIYESLAYEERIYLNEVTARLLEDAAEDEGAKRESLLPAIEFHYSRTANFVKAVNYKEELGCLLIKRYQCVEGVRTLESLHSLVAGADGAGRPGGGGMMLIPPVRRARWLAFLCQGYSVLRTVPKEKVAGTEALEILLRKRWPRNEKQLRVALRRLKARVLGLWILTAGGRRVTAGRKVGNVSEAHQGVETVDELIKMALTGLIESIVFDKSLVHMEVYYIYLLMVNQIIQHNVDRVLWCWLMEKMTFYSLFFAPHLRDIFHRSAAKFDGGLNHPKYTFTKAMNLHFQGYLHSVLATELFERSATFCKARGDVGGYFWGHVVGISIAFYRGDITYVLERSYPIFEAYPALKDEPVMPQIMFFFLFRMSLLRAGDNVADIARWRAAYHAHLDAFPGVVVFRGGPEFYDAWWLLLKGDISSSLALMEKAFESVYVNDITAIVMDWVATAPFALVLLADPCRSALPLQGYADLGMTSRDWSTEERGRLMALLRVVRGHAYTLGTLRKFVFAWWGMHVLDALLEIMNGRPVKACRLLKRRMSGRRREELEEAALYKALCCGMVAKYSMKEDRDCYDTAKEIFTRIQVPVYLKWLDT